MSDGGAEAGRGVWRLFSGGGRVSPGRQVVRGAPLPFVPPRFQSFFGTLSRLSSQIDIPPRRRNNRSRHQKALSLSPPLLSLMMLAPAPATAAAPVAARAGRPAAGVRAITAMPTRRARRVAARVAAPGGAVTAPAPGAARSGASLPPPVAKQSVNRPQRVSRSDRGRCFQRMRTGRARFPGRKGALRADPRD